MNFFATWYLFTYIHRYIHAFVQGAPSNSHIWSTKRGVCLILLILCQETALTHHFQASAKVIFHCLTACLTFATFLWVWIMTVRVSNVSWSWSCFSLLSQGIWQFMTISWSCDYESMTISHYHDYYETLSSRCASKFWER